MAKALPLQIATYCGAGHYLPHRGLCPQLASLLPVAQRNDFSYSPFMTANGPHVHIPASRILLPLALLASLTLTTGCGGSDPAKLIESARSKIVSGDPLAAIVELKTALHEQPDSGAARFLLGKALLASGDATGAEVALRKALDLHRAENEVVPELARAMFALGKHKELLDQFGKTQLTDPQAVADFKTTLAETHAVFGRREQAQSAAEAALAAVPGYGPAMLFMARAQADRGDINGALSALDAELAKRPQDHRALTLKANLLYFVKNDATGALATYRQAIAAKPKDLDAHGGAMTVLLDKADLAGARAQWTEMGKALPGNAQTLYFEGYLSLLERKLDRAQEITQQLLRIAPDNAPLQQLAGLVQFERGNYGQAENLLSKALQSSPGLNSARRALAQTHLRRGEPAKTLTLLQPLLDRPKPDAADLKTKAQALMQQGDLVKAEEAFAKAAKVNPDNVNRQIDLAVSKVLRGDADAGLAMLRTLAADKDSSAADMPLIATLIKRGDHAGALQAIDAFEKKQPDRPVAANLRASVLLAKGDNAGAKRAFEQALKIQPSFLPAASGLAQLALADNKPTEALKYLDDVLKAAPQNADALLASAALKARTGTSKQDILAMFTSAIRSAPQNAALHLALIEHHLAAKDTKAALEAAQQASVALPGDPTVIEMLGRAQAASGDANQAMVTFKKLAQLLPNLPNPHLRMAQLHLAAKNREAESQSLKRALALAPDNLRAQQALVNAHLATGKTAEAVELVRTIQRQHPGLDSGYLFEGTIEGARRRFDLALQAYRAGMKATGGTSELAMGLHTTLTAMRQPAQANSQAADWLKAHPTDTVFRFYLGDLALSQGDRVAAESHYRDVLKLQPDQPQALNNVAWLMAAAKKPGALAMAEKANQLQPDSAAFMDTLALALAADGQPAKAVQQLQKALAIDAKNPMLRFNLARFLIQAGDKPAAKTELQALAGLGEAFPRQKEVAELLSSL